MAKILKGKQKMEIFFYTIIFIIGTLFGSFYTLAVHRIPKRQDILYTHSYCPNCNHKLGLLDLFPIFSYLILRGKCRYCKEKIRPRYFILELLSGILFTTIAYLTNLSFNTLTITRIIEYGFIVLYLTFIILICGIDKENRQISKEVNIYGIAISFLYMVYLCIVEGANIYRYVIYLILYILVLIFDTITLRKYAKSSYVNGILMSLITMVIFTGEYITACAVILTLLSISIYLLIYKIKNKRNRNRQSDIQISKKLSIGFYLGVSNTLIWINRFII